MVMDANDIIKLKEGDDVWVGNRWNKRAKLQTVVRVTGTRIILDGLREYNMYKRINSDRRQDAGYAYGRSYSMDADYLSMFATKVDRKKWDVEVARKKAASEAREAKQTQQENLRLELSDLLPGKLYVQQYTNGTERVVFYGINGLSEEQVRLIAKYLKRLKPHTIASINAG